MHRKNISTWKLKPKTSLEIEVIWFDFESPESWRWSWPFSITRMLAYFVLHPTCHHDHNIVSFVCKFTTLFWIENILKIIDPDPLNFSKRVIDPDILNFCNKNKFNYKVFKLDIAYGSVSWKVKGYHCNSINLFISSTHHHNFVSVNPYNTTNLILGSFRSTKTLHYIHIYTQIPSFNLPNNTMFFTYFLYMLWTQSRSPKWNYLVAGF